MEEISIDDEYDDGSDEGVNGFDFVNNSSSSQPNPQEISPNTQSGIFSSDLPCQNIGDSPNSNGQLTIKSTSTIKNSVSVANSSRHLNNSGEKLHRRGPGRPRKDILVQAPATASRRGCGAGNRIVKQHNSSHGFLRTTKSTSVRRNHIAGASKPNRTNPTTNTASLTTQENNSFMSNVMLSSPLNDDGSNSLTSTPSITMETDQSPDLKFSRSLSYDLSKDTQQRRDSPAVTSNANSNFVSSSEKVMQPPGELPFFPEKWPGKLCALCCLGERSQLGQGEMLRIKVSENEPKPITPLAPMLDSSPTLQEEEKNQRGALNAQTQLSNRRQKGLNKCKNPVLTTEYVDELEMIGHPKIVEFSSLIDGGYFYIHRTCAIWSMGITKDLATGVLGNVDEVVSQSLKRKCSFCNRYGAHMACKMSCPKHFHLPCVAASGGFQIIQNFTAFCKEHLGQVPLVCTEDINCRKCYGLGDVSNLMICSICGDHYHGICIGVAQLPGVRAGWQCTSCRRCQICRVPDAKQADGRSLSCEQCHKMYHANCLRPVMTSIPKYGWKCRCCRICLDCGSRTPGAGTSSRWHSHYTVCDSCYQQRNKGFSCPCCSKAYRAAAYREMVKCSQCNKFVHSTCDADADLAAYHAKKESNPDYEYTCPPCIKSGVQNGRMLTMRRTNSIDDDSLAASQESLSNDNDQLDSISITSSIAMDITEKSNDFGLGKGKPLSANKMIAKKRLPGVVGRPKGGGKFSFQRKQRVSEFGRKRGPKAKMRGVFGVPGLGLQRPTSDSNNKTDEEPGVENRLVLCSAKDKYVLTQDICVMCGAIGTDQEGCLISCLQCGQCYHPYCVSVKVTKVILQRGWRCLDCTVCEGCGEKYDESRLILCDDCDISYHIYCIDPPLDIVPHGTWKCKWCAICQKCGSNTPGPNSTWQNSFTECGPCASQSQCAFCSEAYTDGELLIQCTHCERWSHGNCDEIHNEEEAERCIDEGYKCLLCRPKDVLPPHLIPTKKSTQNHTNTKAITPTQSIKSMDDSSTQEICPSYQIDVNHMMDGVCLSESGLSQIKSLQMELVRKKRKNKISTVEPPPVKDQGAGIMAAIESVVAGGSLDNSLEKMEPLDPREEQEIYKDGMIWDKIDSAPPEGFALFTNEQGVVLLRKKRQRNLQKLGIGGFVVRNRTVRKEGANNDIDDTMDGSLPHFTVEESQPADKKKKQNRKKTKTKLLDTYPSYLQEAFFGKIILDKTKTKFEPSSSEDETQNSLVTDDKTIQLSPEEINVLKAHRLKQQKLLEERNKHQISSIAQPPQAIAQNNIPSKLSGNNAINPTMNQTKPILSNVTPNTFRFATIKTDPSSQDIEMVDGNSLPPSNINQCDTAIRKDVVNDIKMEIMDETELNWKPITSNRMGMEWKTSTPPMNNICTSDAVLQKQQQSTQSLPQQRPPGPIVSIKAQIPTTINKLQPNIIGQQSPAAIQMQLNQRALANQPQTNQTMHSLSQIEPIQQTTVVDNKIITQKIISGPITNDLQRIPITQTQVMQINQLQNPVQQTDAIKVEIQTQQSKGNILDMDRTTPNTPIDDSLGNIGSSSASTGNNPKNSERMRQDEVLDGAATISAVLYANTAHPELKIDYPNWDERVKQILKKWRALSNEKRAPFLQKARENRSCLRKNSRAPQTSPSSNDSSKTLSQSSQSSDIPVNNIQVPNKILSITTTENPANKIFSVTTTSAVPQMTLQSHSAQDPEKAGMDIHQKNVRLQEHERQWKQLQAMRAREQQMQQMQTVESPTNQMQMPGNNNNNNNPAPNACPTNIGNQFQQAQHQKTHRMVVGMPAGQQQFQLPQQRAVSVQLPPRQTQIQQRIVQGQFTQIQDISNKNFPHQSVELQTPPSPHNQFPLSPATSSHDQFSRPSSECSQDPYMNSPQTPRSFDHQSPTTSAGHSPANHMHMRTPMHKPNEMQNPIQPANSPSPYSSPGTPSQENNRQLRDLLQQQPQQNTSTFRQPLPPGMIARPPRFIGAPHQIRATMQSQSQPQQFNMNPVQQQTVKPVISVQNNSTINPSTDSMSTNMTQQQVPTNVQSNMNNPIQQQCAPNAQTTGQQPMNTENFSINMEPKMNHGELEKMDDLEKMDKLEDDDLLGALGGEDDDDLFSFAEEMGSDFNILEYADPELDAESEANLLDSLDFDDTDEKEKAKKAALAKASEMKAVTANQIRMNMSQNNEQAGSSGSIQQRMPQPQTQQQMQMQMSAQQRMQMQRNNPPPYPNPPPPYPDKEQPLLLEDLLEQEKREKEERERQASVNNDMTNPNSSSLLSDQDFERLRADVLATQQGIPAQGLLPIQQQQMIQQQSQASQQQFVPQNAAVLSQQAQGIRQQFLHRNMVNQQQVFQQPIKPNAKQLPNKQSMGNVFQGTNQIINAQEQDIGMESTVVKKEGIPMFVANFQAAPSIPPDTIVTEQDRQMQINYEQWLYSHENILNNQRDYYDAEVTKLRKSKKSLTTKQRILKKSGSDLTQNEALELSKVLREQAQIQKHLEQSRKQCRQHASTLQEYKNKQQNAVMKANAVRQQMVAVNQPGQIVSPHNPTGGQTPHPNLMASSPSPAQANIMQMSVQSPLGNPSMHSPSPLMAQSPISNNILQSPGNPNMSPYNNSMPSPRINSVEMQQDDSPFSPGPMSASPSPSLPGRLTSPAPRMTSPQHHRLTGQPMHSPSHVVYQQQTIKRPPQEFHQQQQMIQMQRQQQMIQMQRQQQMMQMQMQQQQQNQIQQQQQNQIQQGFMMNKQGQNQVQMQQQQMPMNQQQAAQQQHQLAPGGLPPAGYIYNKPGLRGGAPVHGMNRGAKRLPNQVASGSSSGKTVTTIKKTTSGGIKVTGTIKASGSRIIHRGKVANIMTQNDYDDTSNSSSISSPGNLTAQTQSINRNIKRTVSDSCYTTERLEDIVLIHDSPDEKQRIMDYDDDNDKSVIGPEVSLSSVAQNDIIDDDIIYDSSCCKSTGSDVNFVSSPLESEVVEEYQLFPCVADYVDESEQLRIHIEDDDEDNKSIIIDSSDEDGKNRAPESPIYLDDMNLDTNSEEHFATTEEEIMSMNSEIIIMENVKSPDEQLHATSEDFEAMIDSGNSKDGKESNSSIELMEIESEQDIPTTVTPTIPKQLPKQVTISKESPALHERTVITLCYPTTTSSAQIKGRPIQTAIVSKGAVFPTGSATSGSAHLVKDATSAKYLLGNTTISVPVVKNIFSYRKPTGVIADKTGQIRAVTNKNSTGETTNKKIIGQPIISTSLANITGKKTNTTNYVTLSPLSIQHTSGGRIMQAKIVRTQPNQQIVTSANQLKIDSQFKKTLQPTLTYTKISSFSPLKMSQDVSLPTKLFEDESISPDSSIEQDESDLMLTEETIYTTEDTSQSINTSNIDANKSQSGNIQNSTSPTISSLSNTDRIIEVDEMLNDDWKRKSPSKTENQVIIEKAQEETEKKKAVVPVHLIIKQRDTSQNSGQTLVNHRLSSNLPQLSPLSQPNEITSNIGNASQQLRSIMSSINQNSINTSVSQTTANQNKAANSAVEIKSIPNTNVVVTSTIAPTVKVETPAGTAIPTTFENVLNRSSDVNVKTEVLELQKNVSEIPPTQITANKVLNTAQGTFVQANSVPSITTTSTGSIVLVKQIRNVSSLTNRNRSPITVNSTGNKTQTFSVVKSSIGGSPIIISGQSAQQGSSVIIAHNKIPILTKIQTDAGSKLQTTIVPTVNSIAVASSTVTTSTINASETSKSTQSTSSILSNTLSQPHNSRIIPYGDGHFTLKKPHALIVTTRAGFITNKVPAAVSSSVTSASSTAAIQNILQTSLYSQPQSGSILNATLSQPSQKANNTLLQSQLTSNNPFRRSKSTDEVPGFLKETPAQIISKRHTVSAMESLNIVKDEKDDTIVNNQANQKPIENNATENCKFNTVTIVPHKSDDSQNVLLKQLLQNSGSNTTPPTTPSSIPTIVSRSVTSLRAPSLGVVSSLEAQLARPVILPVPSTPQMKSNAISTASTPTSNSQSFNVQMNSTSKNMSGTVVTTSIETPKITVRNNQIVSRETSFVSKPACTEEKEESTGGSMPVMPTNHVCTTVTASTPLPIPSTTATGVTIPQSTITITTKPSQPIQNQAPTIPDANAVNNANGVTSSITTITTSTIAVPPKARTPFQTTSQMVEPKIENSIVTPMSTDTIKIEPIIAQTSEANVQNMATFSKSNTESGNLSTILHTVIKQEESTTSQPSPTPISRPPSILSNADVKREFLDDNSQMSAASDNSSIKQESIKEELITNETIMDPEMAAKIASEKALELKRKKRREYQKQRRQLQTQNKDNANNAASVQAAVKKKSRKVNAASKFDEDYDTFIDNLMNQLKLMPPMQILEPTLNRNYLICTAYGAGDVGKFGSDRDRVLVSGDLKNSYGRAELENTSDHYNTKPFGCKSPLSEQHNSLTHYGFYDQEFSPIKFNTDDDNRCKYDFLKERDIETPDTIISSSSPECVIQDSPSNFPGLRLIQEDDDDEIANDSHTNKRMSPQIPIVAPVPIRLKKGISLSTDQNSNTLIDKTANTKDMFATKSRFGPPIPPNKDINNVTITLTLSSSAADDIQMVLQDLANILHIPTPKSYQIVERTTTPPSQKLGLYRTRGKDGKEGAPIDIQTILNGNAKFCRHCDVVILNTVIRAKAYEFPLLTQNISNELMTESDDLYFCSKSCYKQFRCVPTNILEDKIPENPSNTDRSTYDDTIKYGKNPNVLLTTATSITEKSESQDDESGKENIPNNDDSKMINKTDVNNDGFNTILETKNIHKLPEDDEDRTPPPKKQKSMQYLKYSPSCFKSSNKFKKMTEKETTDMLFRMNITVTPSPKIPEDTRKCIFCHQIGDGVADGPSRLLNFDVDKWVHLNCALWSDGVYETVNGALMNLENALQQSFVQQCTLCQQYGATIKCFKNRCANIYHLNCAIKDKCVFYKTKTMLCMVHAPKTEKDNELTTLSVQRRVYVERDEGRQVASVMHHSELSNLLRVGSLIFLNVGQLLPHQLQNFHTPYFIYPIGYKIMRFYWSMRRPNKRCRYICSIADVSGRPEFRVLVQEPSEEDIELRDSTPKAIWQRILEKLAQLRKNNNLVQIFPKYITGEDLFGLTEPAVVRILESLPGIETLTDYRFKYGRNPLLELPLAINPSGAARTEPKAQQNLSWKKPHTQRSGSASQRPTKFVASTSVAGEVACPYSKQFVHSKSSQYKKMKQEWRNNVFLARSKIQGLGLYAARDLEKHTMVIEYIGEVIRSELSELREKQYEAKNRGIYMFRLDEDRVVDATLSGGLARYINHSCNPNCVTEIVEVDREFRIIIFAKRRINRGEELSYDYKFDIEDDSHKISCMCGAPNCRKWMN